MKKLLLLLLLSLGLTSISYGGYLDDWPDDALCGWMDNPSPPAHIVAEVKKRGISCDSGVASKKTKTSTKEKTQESLSILPKDVEIFSTPDISQKTIEVVKEWYKIGANAWGRYGPIEIYIVHSS